MTTTKPDVSPAGRYDTKTVCAQLGISRSTLMRYRKNGFIRPWYHKANMRPYFKGTDIVKLWLMIM